MRLSAVKRSLRTLALVAANAALVFGACGEARAARPAPPGRYSTWRAAAAGVLSEGADPRSLAAAAALRFLARSGADPSPDAARSAALELAAKAGELEPNDVLIAWLRLQLCAGAPGCDIRDAATTMRWLDPDNSAVWLATLALAQKDHDAEQVTRLLQEMAHGTKFAVYRNGMVVLLFDALKRAAARLPGGYVPSDLSRLSEAMAVAQAEIVPAFAPLLAACRELGTERRENCLKLARLMRRADTVSAQMAGLGIERRLVPADGREARAIAERRRVLEWRVFAASQYDAPALPWLTNSLARARVREMRLLAREEDVDIAILRQHKIPLEPPPERPR